MQPSDLHLRYAAEIAALGGIKSPALRRALARVRREEFLPPGPWMIESLEGMYYPSDDADIAHILHGVGVAIDPARILNNGNPVRVCTQFEAAGPRPGDSLFHIGAGYGYYSALLAELVGPEGSVLAAEIDPFLREQAKRNLAGWPQVSVIEDALAADLPPVDIIFSSAGLGTIPRAWIDALRPGGRMVLPVTGAYDNGAIFLFTRQGAEEPLTAKLLSFCRHYPCLGSRPDPEIAAISAAFARPVTQVTSLRTDPHVEDRSCWLHRHSYCLSTQQSVTDC